MSDFIFKQFIKLAKKTDFRPICCAKCGNLEVLQVCQGTGLNIYYCKKCFGELNE